MHTTLPSSLASNKAVAGHISKPQYGGGESRTITDKKRNVIGPSSPTSPWPTLAREPKKYKPQEIAKNSKVCYSEKTKSNFSPMKRIQPHHSFPGTPDNVPKRGVVGLKNCLLEKDAA